MRSLAAILIVAGAGLLLAGCGADKKYDKMKSPAAKSAGGEGRVRRADAEFHRADFAESDVSRTESPEHAPRDFESKELADRREYEHGYQNRSSHQAGTLTAGSLDDNAGFDEFRSYLSAALQYDAGRTLPQVAIGRRVVIRVENEQGEGIADAQVVVHGAQSRQEWGGRNGSDGPVLLDTTTGSDGQALFFTGTDAAGSGSEFELTVEPPDGTTPLSRQVSVDQGPWTVTLPKAERRLPRQLDLTLVIDTTGSMGDELEYLKVEIDSIAAAVHDRFPNVAQRYALVLYRDEGDQYVTRTFDFTDSLPRFRSALAAQSASGGGDYPEAVHLALEQAERLSWRDRETARIVFLVADAPPHDRHTPRTLETVRRLRTRGVTVFPVAASGARERAELVMRLAALVTQGQYLFLTDHSGVGLPHAKPHAAEYNVERLDQLMIRMIASKLAGRWLLPRDVIGSEAGDAIAAPRPLPPAQRQSGEPQASRQELGYERRTAAAGSMRVPDGALWVLGIAAMVVFILLERAFASR